MGVDAKLLLRPSLSVNDVIIVLKTLGKTNVKYKPTQHADYATVYFDSTSKRTEIRTLSIFLNTKEYLGMPMQLLTLGSDEESIEVLSQLGKMIGGLFQAQDVDNTWEIFPVPGDGNIRWLLNQYFLRNTDIPKNADAQLGAFLRWYDKDEV